MNLNNDVSHTNSGGTPSGLNLPFLLSPAGKDYLWGGRRLRDDFSKELDMEPLAETWECSTHPDGPSYAASGPDRGRKLIDILRDHPEYIGSHPRVRPDGGLPVLVKLIDASLDLSVQVHPDDDYACRHENGSLGKTEMWYVVDAKKDAGIIYGFSRDMTQNLLKKSLEDGSVGRYLQRVKVKKDDVYAIEPGTVHGIGAGTLVAEIQESSNITYRLFDYNRKDREGNLRELHIDKGLEVSSLRSSSRPRQPIRVLNYRPGAASELLYRCRHFQVERLMINTERVRNMADIRADSTSFRILLCIDGCAAMFAADDEAVLFPYVADGRNDVRSGRCWTLFRGDCMFIPADSVPLKLHGKAQFLVVMC